MKDKQIGIPDVIEKWGVAPEKMIDLQAMTGNSVDNVPGIPGIGPKTAAQLLAEYGDLDTLLERATEIKQEKRRQTIIENADKARLSARTRAAAHRRAARSRRRRSCPRGTKRAEANRLSEGDAIHQPDAPRCGGLRMRRRRHRRRRRTVEWGASAHGPDLDVVEPEPVAGGIPDIEGSSVPVPAKPNGKSNGVEGAFLPGDLVKARAEAFATLPFDPLALRDNSRCRDPRCLDRGGPRHGDRRLRYRDHLARRNAGGTRWRLVCHRREWPEPDRHEPFARLTFRLPTRPVSAICWAAAWPKTRSRCEMPCHG